MKINEFKSFNNQNLITICNDILISKKLYKMKKTVIPNFFLRKKRANFIIKKKEMINSRGQSKKNNYLDKPKITHEKTHKYKNDSCNLSFKKNFRNYYQKNLKPKNFFIKKRKPINSSLFDSSKKYSFNQKSIITNKLNLPVRKYFSIEKSKKNDMNISNRKSFSSLYKIKNKESRFSFRDHENISFLLKGIRTSSKINLSPSIIFEKELRQITGLKIYKFKKISDKFMIIKNLGNGSSANVNLVQDIGLGEKFVVKIICFRTLSSNKKIKIALVRFCLYLFYQNEIQHLHELKDHPEILYLNSVIITKHSYGIISPFTKSINLKQFLKSTCLTFCKARLIFDQIVRALKICHDKFIAHRDLKLDNIIINQELKIKLIDFGYSTKVITPSDKKNVRFCGTPLYMAPNVILKNVHNRIIYLFILN